MTPPIVTDRVEIPVDHILGSRLVLEVGHRTYIVPVDRPDKGIWGVLLEVHATTDRCVAIVVPDE